MRNHGGAPAGPDSATFTLTDDAGHSLGSCTANIPPIDHNQTETIERAVAGPDWANFAARGGGSYSASVHNAIYDG